MPPFGFGTLFPQRLIQSSIKSAASSADRHPLFPRRAFTSSSSVSRTAREDRGCESLDAEARRPLDQPQAVEV
jgi:hypothetical protein